MKKRQMRTRYLWIEYGILEHKEITSSDILVYMGLARFVDNETQTCYPSISSLEKLCRLNKSTIIKSIRHLEKLNMIEVERTPNKVSHYKMLEVGGGNFQLGEMGDSCGGNEGQQLVEIRETNNTYINNTYLTTPTKKDFSLPLEEMPSRVRKVYALIGDGYVPTKRFVSLIEEDFVDYKINSEIKKMMDWYESKRKVPTTLGIRNWLLKAKKDGNLERR